MLRIISDIRGKDGIHSAHASIATSNIYSLLSSFDERLQDEAHGHVEEFLHARFTLAFGEPLLVDFGDWQVTDENTSMLRWFASNGAGDVTQSKVNRVCALVSGELCQLRLIGCQYDWCYRRAFGQKRLPRY